MDRHIINQDIAEGEVDLIPVVRPFFHSPKDDGTSLWQGPRCYDFRAPFPPSPRWAIPLAWGNPWPRMGR